MTTAALQHLANAKAALRKAELAVDAERSRLRIHCACGKKHAIKDLDLIVTHYYIHPHGCTGGDYWLEGEWNFVCPVGVRNRLMFNDYDLDWDKRDVFGVAAQPTFKRYFRRLFKSSTDEHQEGPKGGHNNYFVDENRRKFGLPPKQGAPS